MPGRELPVKTGLLPVISEGYEDLSKIEEKRGNYEKALEYMEIAGQNSTTGFYPKEIARLKEIVKNL